MKIGVTSQNFRTITAHAGKARRFMVFEASDGCIVRTAELDLPKEMSIHEHPCHAAHPIDGLDVLITGSCGEGFLKKLAERGIRVILTSETDPQTAVAAVASGASLPQPLAEEDDHDDCQCHCAAAARTAL
jgi:predicted Fe-Mo cluster-binding NifX family protein